MFLLVLIALVLLVGGMWLYAKQQLPTTMPIESKEDTQTATTTVVATPAFQFTVDDGSTGSIVYTNPADTAELTIGGTTYDLALARAASGARYDSADGTVTYWEHQGEATITIASSTYTASNLTPADVLTFTVAPQRQDCVGVAPMRCLVVDGAMFYDTITGFDYVEGNSYVIKVLRTKRDNPPADASAYQYQLQEIISINGKDNDIVFDSTTGTWKDKYGVCHTCTPENGFGLDGQLLTTAKTEAVAPLLRYSPEGTTWTYDGGTLSFVDGRYQMDFGCNNISGNFTADRTTLTFGPARSTKMACAADLMAKEAAFGTLITQMDTFTETSNGAQLSGGNAVMQLERPN